MNSTVGASAECARSPFLVPNRDGIGGGTTEADNGREAAGGFGGGKKFVEEILSGADCDEEGPGGTAGFTNRQLDANRLFFLVGQIRPSSVGEIDRKIADLSPANLAAQENVTCVRPVDRSRGSL